MRNADSVVLFLIDGMRPDGLRRADTPVIDGLVKAGASTMSAQTVMPTTTLPCHTSLFFSLAPQDHGILDNTWKPLKPSARSLFGVLSERGMAAASFFNWEPLRNLSPDGALAASFFLKDRSEHDGSIDRELASLAVRWLKANPFQFAFVYMHNTDRTGHSEGWMSDKYLQSIANADACIGEVMGVLDGKTAVIVMSDHGGHDRTHHSDRPEDMTIPFIIRAPGVRGGSGIPGDVRITDVAPTIAALLGVEAPDSWVGAKIAV
ncbi:MAG: 2,3-bisphosphoglycerate-independent phosphoglycerate mutase [Syntrophaceae bacterium PtaU1.Bin231]|nr:MAG: 2,3-bisphosphoglycerate-independent phosphoglycerate mutase [Syntrophaceae bacterium PtaU1.Bin231]HOG17858.1 alkaline phosphatase family protein [Syntrophales bacterium]